MPAQICLRLWVSWSSSRRVAVCTAWRSAAFSLRVLLSFTLTSMEDLPTLPGYYLLGFLCQASGKPQQVSVHCSLVDWTWLKGMIQDMHCFPQTVQGWVRVKFSSLLPLSCVISRLLCLQMSLVNRLLFHRWCHVFSTMHSLPSSRTYTQTYIALTGCLKTGLAGITLHGSGVFALLSKIKYFYMGTVVVSSGDP